MNNLKEKLLKLQSGKDSLWKEKAKYRRDNRDWLKVSAAIAVKILASLKTKGLSQRELAERMGVSPQQVNKIVKGQENLTLETISKIEAVLGINIIAPATRGSKSAA